MKKMILGLFLFSAFSSFASETCTVKSKRGFHPDGTPAIKIAVSCSDEQLERAIFFKYEAFRIGRTSMFLKDVKTDIDEDILSAGYKKINSSTYIKL